MKIKTEAYESLSIIYDEVMKTIDYKLWSDYIIDIAKDLFEEFLETKKELRLVGVRVTGLKPAEGEKKEAKLGKWLGKQSG